MKLRNWALTFLLTSLTGGTFSATTICTADKADAQHVNTFCSATQPTTADLNQIVKSMNLCDNKGTIMLQAIDGTNMKYHVSSDSMAIGLIELVKGTPCYTENNKCVSGSNGSKMYYWSPQFRPACSPGYSS